MFQQNTFLLRSEFVALFKGIDTSPYCRICLEFQVINCLMHLLINEVPLGTGIRQVICVELDDTNLQGLVLESGNCTLGFSVDDS